MTLENLLDTLETKQQIKIEDTLYIILLED